MIQSDRIGHMFYVNLLFQSLYLSFYINIQSIQKHQMSQIDNSIKMDRLINNVLMSVKCCVDG